MEFESLPRPFKQAIFFVYGYRNRVLRFGAEYKAWRRLLRETKHYGREEALAWQLERLKSLKVEARGHTEHYYQKLQPETDQNQGLDLCRALETIPKLAKKDLRDGMPSFENTSLSTGMSSSTSGSTGSPMHVKHDWASIQRRQALMADHLSLSNLSPFDVSVRLSGRILFRTADKPKRPWLYNPAERQIFLSTYHLKQKYSETIEKYLTMRSPKIIDGYPSAIIELLRLLPKGSPAFHGVKVVITTAETLSSEQRREIEDLANARVLDYYSASEGIPLIQQCAHGTYHVRWQSGILEVEGNRDPQLEGSGELICTSFVQDKTPLIRYKTGDTVAGLKNDFQFCACGQKTPTVDGIGGRVEDHVLTADGRKIGMFTYRTLKKVEGILEAQVIQENNTTFTVNSIISADTTKAAVTEALKIQFAKVMGYEVDVVVNLVEALPKGPNGKVRLVISKVHK